MSQRGKVYATGNEARIAQRKVEANILKALHISQREAAHAQMRVVKRDMPVDRGELKAGLEVKSFRRPGRGTDRSEVRLESNAPHAGVSELGARPFWPPIKPLYEWAQRKAGDLGLASLAKGGRSKSISRHTAAETANIMAFAKAVQRKISRVGLKPHYSMKKSLPFAVKAMDRSFRRHLKRIAEGGGVGGGNA